MNNVLRLQSCVHCLFTVSLGGAVQLWLLAPYVRPPRRSWDGEQSWRHGGSRTTDIYIGLLETRVPTSPPPGCLIASHTCAPKKPSTHSTVLSSKSSAHVRPLLFIPTICWRLSLHQLPLDTASLALLSHCPEWSLSPESAVCIISQPLLRVTGACCTFAPNVLGLAAHRAGSFFTSGQSSLENTILNFTESLRHLQQPSLSPHWNMLPKWELSHLTAWHLGRNPM
ncbi:PREDICTED: uncharacterized protein LOC102013407 isoform X2 [Chinchilla lanigera]|uniref:uncharacterized protein LOC102013407 isoform X2 n=1 Tax=Chinchilla lanigera TaxID=34839 RepID=UPI00038F1223|nr:PREDICTED: uncharacterized protein LOC102013407 isoform X2 [Chinchilla lanigera]